MAGLPEKAVPGLQSGHWYHLWVLHGTLQSRLGLELELELARVLERELGLEPVRQTE
jgi:hypothetical protein